MKKTSLSSAAVFSIPAGTDRWETPTALPPGASLTVRVGKNARVTLTDILQTAADSHVTRTLTIETLEGSSVRLFLIQRLPGSVHFKQQIHIQAHAGATVHLIVGQFGSGETESAVTQEAIGPNARLDTTLIAHTRESQRFSLAVSHRYSHAHGKGVITARGAAEDESRLTMDGSIAIKQKGGGTDARLDQAILNLSPRATVRATPALKIDTNDVKASHSAGITNLNEDMLFYMASRGLSRPAAKKMLIEGFLADGWTMPAPLPRGVLALYNLLR